MSGNRRDDEAPGWSREDLLKFIHDPIDRVDQLNGDVAEQLGRFLDLVAILAMVTRRLDLRSAGAFAASTYLSHYRSLTAWERETVDQQERRFSEENETMIRSFPREERSALFAAVETIFEKGWPQS